MTVSTCTKPEEEDAATPAAPISPAPASFTPPADGKLTEDHIALFLKVREHVSKMKWADAGGADKFLPMDVKAAKDLRVDLGEYQWVKQTINETLDASLRLKLGDTQRQMLERQLSMIQEQKAKATSSEDRESQEIFEEKIRSVMEAKQQLDEQTAASETLLHNQGVLKRYGVGNFVDGPPGSGELPPMPPSSP